MQISLLAIAECLVLIGGANAVPVALKRILSNRYSKPVDGGLVLRDGRRLLGPSKTWRGVAFAILVPACLSPLMGLSWRAGALVGATAMAGDFDEGVCSAQRHRHLDGGPHILCR
jgi:CDP-2,3-bis-(O-geranylgeranyl)-sn-glycerol synthase